MRDLAVIGNDHKAHMTWFGVDHLHHQIAGPTLSTGEVDRPQISCLQSCSARAHRPRKSKTQVKRQSAIHAWALRQRGFHLRRAGSHNALYGHRFFSGERPALAGPLKTHGNKRK